jgi:hypothetical protein
MSITDRPLKPQACVVEGDKVGIFIGSSYRQLNLEQAQTLHSMIGEAIEQLVSSNPGALPTNVNSPITERHS